VKSRVSSPKDHSALQTHSSASSIYPVVFCATMKSFLPAPWRARLNVRSRADGLSELPAARGCASVDNPIFSVVAPAVASTDLVSDSQRPSSLNSYKALEQPSVLMQWLDFSPHPFTTSCAFVARGSIFNFSAATSASVLMNT